jgi:hypothetical protein
VEVHEEALAVMLGETASSAIPEPLTRGEGIERVSRVGLG